MSSNSGDPTVFTDSVLIGDTNSTGGAPGTLPALTKVMVDGRLIPVCAALELQTIDSALLLPRMTTDERNALVGVAEGMLLYNTSTNSLNIFQKVGVGFSWEPVESGPGNGDVVGPNGGVSTNEVVVFSDSTGKSITGGLATFNLVSAPVVGGNVSQLSDIQEISFTGTSNFITVNDDVVSIVGVQNNEPLTVFTDSTYDAASALNSCSLLEINSDRAGLLNARMSAAEMNAIATPVDGLQIYNTDTNSLNVYQNGAWASLELGTPPAPADATYIIQTPNAALSGSATVMSTLNTGIVKNTIGTGISIAAPVDLGNFSGDYYGPGHPLYLYGDSSNNLYISNAITTGVGSTNTILATQSITNFGAQGSARNVVIGNTLANSNVNYGNSVFIGYSSDIPSSFTSSVSNVVSIGVDLQADNQSVAIGVNSISTGGNAIAIGNTATNTNVANGIVIGTQSSNGSSPGISIGYQANIDANSADSIVIGSSAGTTASASSVILGKSASSSNVTNAVAIGVGASCTSATSMTNAVAIGNSCSVQGDSSIGIGANTICLSNNNIVLCQNSSSTTVIDNNSNGAIVIGNTSSATASLSSISIGVGASCTTSPNGTAIGTGALCATSDSGIAIGQASVSNQPGGLALGYNSSCDGQNSSAIGANAIVSIDDAINLGNESIVGINNPTPIFALDINNVTNASSTDVTGIKFSFTPTDPNILGSLLPLNTGMLFIDTTGQLHYAYNDGTVHVTTVTYS